MIIDIDPIELKTDAALNGPLIRHPATASGYPASIQQLGIAPEHHALAAAVIVEA